jgi:hypothetical protein
LYGFSQQQPFLADWGKNTNDDMVGASVSEIFVVKAVCNQSWSCSKALILTKGQVDGGISSIVCFLGSDRRTSGKT